MPVLNTTKIFAIKNVPMVTSPKRDTLLSIGFEILNIFKGIEVVRERDVYVRAIKYYMKFLYTENILGKSR